MNVYEIREKLGDLLATNYTLNKLAKVTGVSRKTLGEFLTLKRIPNIVTVLKIKKFLEGLK